MQLNNKNFVFKDYDKVKEIINKYPANGKISAVMPLLHLAQDQNNGMLTNEVIEHISDILSMPFTKIKELVTFYTMYNEKKIGKYHIQICRTTPCWICKSEAILNKCKELLNININQTTNDELFTLSETECLGACVDAPIVKINNDYYEHVTEEKIISLIKEIQITENKNQKG